MTQHDSGTPKPTGTAAFSKFVHLLQLVADSPEPLSIPKLAALSGYPRPTVYRSVGGLVAEGLLIESLNGETYQLGPRLIQFASRSWDRSELRLVAVQALKALRDQTGETVHLAVPSDDRMVYIEKLESTSAVRMASYIGSSVCMHSSSVGKAYLAALPQAQCLELVQRLEYARFTDHTVTTPQGLLEQVRQVQEQGWSVDDEENEAGIYCFGAVILGAGQKPVAAISISTLKFMQAPDPIQAYVQPLLDTCRHISQRIIQSPVLADSKHIW
ncbi:MAG TPA: IclR family transcriptional regulator [Alcaligenes sp.]|nr:IclR family transcriptional regulator [Alcaligenes sp.]